ncbi:UDP-N-acetylglucosamine 2-epimerase (hydrolyzing) [bacterium]|nr:UDP-N-acetylglucosamine 2-epimerase (hydrolyzing) [bacterium]
MKITAVLVDRANYGRLKPILEIMRDDCDVELSLVCTGTMLLERFGRAVDLVKNDGFDVSEEIYIELEGSVPSTMAKSIGLAVIELSNAFQRQSPDFVLLIGDRSEALGAAIAAVYQNYCLIHIQGGEITGSIDESARHAITKLAHYHFPSTKQARKNIVQMGERKETVFSYGCPSVDVVSKIRKYPSPTILNEGVGPELNFAKEYLLVLFHPVTTEYSSSEKQMEEVLSAIKELNMQTLLIWPNIDAGSDGVSQEIRRFREYNNSTQLHAYKNFEPEEYIPLLDNAVCAIGNSSSFIRDASFLGTPVVLVGTRQDGRERTKAVIRVVENKDKIVDAVKCQINHGRYEASNLYGTVGASTRIVKQIKLLEKYKQKQFVTKN